MKAQYVVRYPTLWLLTILLTLILLFWAPNG